MVAVNFVRITGRAHLLHDPQDSAPRCWGVWNAPRPVRILNVAIRWRDAGDLLHENAVGSQLRSVAGVWTKSEGIAGFELDGHTSLRCLDQVVRFAGKAVAKRHKWTVWPLALIGILGDNKPLWNSAPRNYSTGVDPDE
jgi:hypothetical protein